MKQQLANLLLYRWRYIVGYGLLAMLFVLAVITASLYAPGGVTQAEITAIERTNLVAAGNFSVPNLPLHLVQWLSFTVFGVSLFSIKLPAIIFSTIAAVALFFLLRRWFKPNVAILSMLIMTTTGQFMFLAQHATSQILYVMYSALILLFASLILQKAKGHLLWKICLAASVALSCYTPYFIYINLVLLVAALFHPHTRHHLMRRPQRLNWFIAFSVLILLVAPLAYICYQTPELLTKIIGHESLELDILANILIIVKSYLWIEPIMTGSHIAPIMDFSSLALVTLGAIVLLRHRYTARTYVIAAWLLLTLPILLFRPQLTAAMIVPLFILLAVGVETLLSEWYKLFPKNPYARGAGLVLLIGLIGLMVFSGVDRFTRGYRHLPMAVHGFSKDISLVRQQLNTDNAKAGLIVSADELPLYSALASYDDYDLSVSTNPHDVQSSNMMVTHDALKSVHKDWTLRRIVTNDRTTDGDRLYLYKAD